MADTSFAMAKSPTPSPSPSHSAGVGHNKRKRMGLEDSMVSLHHGHPSSSFGMGFGHAIDTGMMGDDYEIDKNGMQAGAAPASKTDEYEEEEEDANDDEGEEEGEEEEEEEEQEEEDEEEPDSTTQQFSAGGPARPPALSLPPPAVNVKVEPAPADSSRDAMAGQLPFGTSPQPVQVNVKEESKVTSLDAIQTSGAYCSREENLKKEEDAGRINFVCFSNDRDDQHMIWLIGLKNIFSRQLPNMPKEYIVRLVMDRTHKSMMIIKQNQVIGGITYRPYPSQKFGEIAFCAITADEQVKGFGTRLMNHLKKYARDEDGLTHFLTYADNNAVGYFTKQGFTKEIYLDKEIWQGYIKDYDGGTLMECRIDPKLPYIDLPSMIRLQRQAIDEKIRELSNCHIVYPGLEIPKKEYGIPRRQLKIEDIPGLKEAGWTPEQTVTTRARLSGSDGPPSKQALHGFMRSLLKVVTEHADAWPFREPVDAREVPDYYEIIKDPIDLKTISRRIESELFYLTLEMFEADLRRMFANARIYNSPETIYFKCANRLEAFFVARLQIAQQVARHA